MNSIGKSLIGLLRLLKQNKIGALVGLAYSLFQVNLYQILQLFEICAQPPTGCEGLVTTIWTIDIIPKSIYLVIISPFTFTEYPPVPIAIFALVVSYFVFILLVSKLEQIVRRLTIRETHQATN